MSMMSITNLGIVAIGDEDMINGLRLAGIGRYYVIKDDQDTCEGVRKALTEVISDSSIGMVMILEDYVEYVEDIANQIRKGRRMTPVIIEVPSKFGTKYQDIREYYKAFIRESVGFDVEI